MRARDGGVELFGRYGSETGSVKGGTGIQKSPTGIGATFTPNFSDKEDSNNNFKQVL